MFCSACGDEGCGGLTADLDIHGNQVSWSNFGWDTNCEPDDEDPVRMETSSAFTFDRGQYEQVLLEARSGFIRQIQGTS